MQFITLEAKGKNVVPAVTFQAHNKRQEHHAAIQSILKLKTKELLKAFDSKVSPSNIVSHLHKKQV